MCEVASDVCTHQYTDAEYPFYTTVQYPMASIAMPDSFGEAVLKA